MRALKKVPSDAKGLKKLPTSVRNKMGYMQDGAKFAPMSNQKISREMVEKDFNESMKKHMQFTNKLAKQLADGVDSRGLPLKPAARKALEKDVKQRKQYEQTARPNYKDVGLRLPKGDAPFEDDAMPKAKYGMKAVKKKMPGGGKMPVYRKGGKIVKYQEGGEIGPDQKKNKGRIIVQELPRNEQKKLGMPARDESYLMGRGKYEDFHNMNLYSATPEEALKYYKMDAAKKLLNKEGIAAGASYSPEQVMSMARKKVDMNAVNKMAKTSFMDWSADRKKNPKAYAGSYRGVGGAQRLKK